MKKIKEALNEKTSNQYMKGGSLSTIIRNGDVVIKFYNGHYLRGYLKLKKEVEYLKNIPKSLKKYFPKVLEVVNEKNLFALSVKNYSNMKSISELSMGHKNIKDIWAILRKILNFMNKKLYLLKEKKITRDYLRITQFQRVENAIEELSNIPDYKELIITKEVTLNGKNMVNAPNLLKQLSEDKNVQEILKPKKLTYFHGNFHLANILTDFEDFVFIDPRGEVYGTKDYDISKMLCHLYVRYDEIHENLFRLKRKGKKAYILNLLDKRIKKRLDYLQKNLINKEFPKLTKKCENKLLLLMGFHAISFSSYHARKRKPNKKRSIAYYLCGVKLLNDYVNNNGIKKSSSLIPYT